MNRSMNKPAHFSRQRGAGAILAMMFLVIFGSLAAAMSIVSQGNLATADSQMKINRSMAGAETGLNFIIHRLNQISRETLTPYGLVTPARAEELWLDSSDGARMKLYSSFVGEFHNLSEPVLTARGLKVGPISIGPGEPTFTATFEPHPLPGPGGAGDYSRYDDPFYQQEPYNNPDLFDHPVSSLNPLDARWIRVVVTAYDGPANRQVTRTISIDFRLDKKLRYAILSRSRVMIGRNVMIEGQVGSGFMETNLEHGHPVQMESDFRGLTSSLNNALDTFVNTLITNDMDGDNRLNIANVSEMMGIANPQQFDTDSDGFITDFDFFLAEFDANDDKRISATELDTANHISRAQLLELIDTFGKSTRPGYNDGFIDASDNYAKIRGQVRIVADMAGWNEGAAGGAYQDHFQGSIHPDHKKAPLTFEADDADVYEFDADDFNVASFETAATGDLIAQASDQYAAHNPDDPATPNMDLSANHREAVPFGSAYPYDYYDRPVFENMTFTNIKIPAGTNALFRNCRFLGVTFIESTADNTDENFNYAGMQESDGTVKYPSMMVNTTDPSNGQSVVVGDSKTVSNNIRFDSCTFEGGIVTKVPQQFTHIRNKISFTGSTLFDVEGSTYLSAEEKAEFRRSTILAPNYSVEIGTFVSPFDNGETVELSGTIVAGIVDMRGQVKITGSLITTFEPQSNTGPVIGETSPQFNTTLGYFSASAGDFEAEMPANGIGVIQLRYDPTLPMPDGITGPIEIRPIMATYYEGVAP